MKKNKKPPKPSGAANLPPSVRVDPAQLKAEADQLGALPQDQPRRGPGRPPGSKNRKEEPESFDYPLEALALLHKGLWKTIAELMRSQYQLTDTGAAEMATWANLCLKQYLSPMMAEYTPLAGYIMAQLAALGTCLAMKAPRVALPPKEGEKN